VHVQARRWLGSRFGDSPVPARPVAASVAAAMRREVLVLADLAVLAPPLLVCAAFLIAVGAFLRHEMRRIKNPDSEEEPDGSSSRRESGESA